MTDDEMKARLAITDLLGSIAQAGDARKADAYAGCFTRDGVLELDQPIEGREAIRAWMTAPSVIPQREDRYASEDGQWLIERRKPRTLWFAPDSLVRRD